MKNLKKYFALIFCVFFTILVKAQEIPPIQNFNSKIYEAENQNWSIAQDSKKNLYFANNSGLLEFNGAKWELYKSPNKTIIRSVKVIKNLIYTGCYREFGYWKRNQFGKLNYTSISKSFKKSLLEDEEFWNIIPLDKWILFQSLQRIYIYNTEKKTFEVINSDTTLQKMFKVNGSIYFQKINDGLYKIESGKPVLVSNAEILKDNIIVDLFLHKGKLTLLTQEEGFYTLKNNELAKWITPSDALLSTISVYSSTQLTDNNIALGTISNGLYLLDSNGNTLKNITQEKGLNNNTVLSISEDIEQNIWLGLDNGISVINLNSPFQVYNNINGKLGTVYASKVFKNYLYLGTNQGLFYKKVDTQDIFQLINGTEGQVWCLKIIDETLFCGHNSGTFVVETAYAKKISNIPGTWDLKKISGKESKILQGNYNGLFVLENKEGNWSLKNKIRGFNNSSRYFEIAPNNLIIINHEYKGIFKVNVDSDYTKVISLSIEKDKKGKKSAISTYKNKILYCYEKGLFKYDANLKKFIPDTILKKSIFLNDSYVSGKLIETDQKLWAFTNNSLIYILPGKLNNTPKSVKISLPLSTRKDQPGFESITHLKNENYLLGTSYGYLLIDTKKILPKKYTIFIDEVSKRAYNQNNVPVKISNDQLVEYSNNNMEFSFSVPTYEKYTETTYQYQLAGYYNKWSTWSPESTVSFKNLPFGDYTFQVRAKVGNTITDNNATFSFTIDRPWYLSNLMIFIYVIVQILIFITIHNLYKQYYKKQKKDLLLKQQREFELSQLESDKVIMKLRNDQLRHDIEGKNRELAASTMSIIKKNEFLNTIKKELSEVKNNDLIKPVIKIIDKNLNNNSDWELFQEAFNNADKDFLKKVKDKHPNLTPNDLRLCAYLRLNLSSKEIAPLLNISPKSVEIKRYRLRQKMGLTTKDNLTHHILEI